MDITLPLLKKGAKGLQVSMLQTVLNLKTEAETELATDGIFGPKTDAAVRDWQQTQQLAVDGIVGPKTWTSILEFGDEDRTDEHPSIVRNL
jgi:peptidoglycan hydrolase-like protein with peptidoglycan-binding domain